jgi:hypothetical protein
VFSFASLLVIGASIYVLFFFGLFSFQEWFKAVAIIASFPLIMLARAYLIWRFATELVLY